MFSWLTSQMLDSSFEQENEAIEPFDPKLHWFHSIQPNVAAKYTSLWQTQKQMPFL